MGTNFPIMKTYILPFVALLFPAMISAGNPQEVADGNNRFAFSLYHAMNDGVAGANQVFSPFSVSTALAMVYAGARNETKTQMSRTLYFPTEEKFHGDYKKLLKDLDEGAAGKIRLNIANGLWAQHDFQFLDPYLTLVRQNYGSELKNVDFKDAAIREQTRKEINLWVEERTNDKIKGLLGTNDLDRLTRLVLVNAIYFYGEWANPFKKESTAPNEFYISEETKIKTPFMSRTGSYHYYEDAKIQALEMPYKDNNASMIIFLPNAKDGMPEFEKLFDFKYYSDILDSFQPTEVRLLLPKYKIDFRIGLGNTLSQMGMPLAFSPGGADFSGMTGKRDLCISKVIHQAFIEVDEKGTEAAAATAVVMMHTSARHSSDLKVFRADHPFIFVIKDNATGSILFMGKIMNPEISGQGIK
jgi:serpin B